LKIAPRELLADRLPPRVKAMSAQADDRQNARARRFESSFVPHYTITATPRNSLCS
jgi:hypothetical protein